MGRNKEVQFQVLMFVEKAARLVHCSPHTVAAYDFLLAVRWTTE